MKRKFTFIIAILAILVFSFSSVTAYASEMTDGHDYYSEEQPQSRSTHYAKTVGQSGPFTGYASISNPHTIVKTNGRFMLQGGNSNTYVHLVLSDAGGNVLADKYVYNSAAVTFSFKSSYSTITLYYFVGNMPSSGSITFSCYLW